LTKDSSIDKPCSLVFIEWEDSRQPVPAWAYLSDFESPTIVKCASVGWLIHDGEDVKTLAPNMGDLGEDDVQVSGVIRIPTRSILRVVNLKQPSG